MRTRALALLSAAALCSAVAPSAAQAQSDVPKFTPSSWDFVFGEAAPGNETAPQALVVQNTGGVPLTLTKTSFTGRHAGDFKVSSDTCTGQTLATNQACQINIRFAPTEAGTRLAYLRIDDNTTCPNYITLAGGGDKQPTARAASCQTGSPSEVTATPTPPPAAAAPGTSGSSSQIQLPSQRSCQSRREFKVNIDVPKGERLTEVVATINGKRVEVKRGKRITATVSLKGLPRGRFTLRVTAKTASGKKFERTRRYVTCVADKG